jgi:hypothetical protein
MRRGQSGEQPFSEFSESILRARGSGKSKLVKSIIDSGDPRVILEYLGRVYPGEYGRAMPREVVIVAPPSPPSPVPVEQPAETKRTVKFLVPDRDIFDAKQLQYFRNLVDHVDALK